MTEFKTEKEKMIAGELYFANDPELVADRMFARSQSQIINQAESAELRSQLLKETFGRTGKKIYMEPVINFDYGYNIFVGENFYANFNCTFLDVSTIEIGDNCMFAPNVQLYTATHPLHPVKRNSGLEYAKPIKIGNNVWLGGGVIVTPGVTLGDNRSSRRRFGCDQIFSRQCSDCRKSCSYHQDSRGRTNRRVS
jgi:maltose O-acetyltransferase